MKTEDFIAEIKDEAIEDMMLTTVLASITIAQGIEESASGRHAPGFNLFGIKSKVKSGQLLWTQEFVNGQYIQIQDWFMKYDDWSGSIADHSSFLLRNQRYTRYGFFLACERLDYNRAAQALQNAGYATNPNYSRNLINIIEKYDLHKYDLEAVNNLKAIEDLQKGAKAQTTKIETLEKKIVALEKVTGIPEWFAAEFGAAALDGLVNDQTGTYEFWRLLAIQLRLSNR